jgi:hypothetical protein
MSQTLTLICRGQTFEYAPSAMNLNKNEAIKTESTKVKNNKIQLIYRAQTFEYTPKSEPVLSYYRDSKHINWRFRIPAKTKNTNPFLFLISLITWKDY